MALNTALQIYRGLDANIGAATATTPGILAYTTDSKRLFVSDGTQFNPIANDITVFNAADQTAMVALAAKVGDLAIRADNNKTYILTTFPASAPANWTSIAVTSGTTIQGLTAPVLHQFVQYIDNAGVQHLAQPSFADISGQLAQTQLPTTIGVGTSLTSFDLGTF